MSGKLSTLWARKRFRSDLLAWYGAQKRDLPWRSNRAAYRVWVSEIMLQQTRVAAVLDHYRRFLRRFPTVTALARARESEVLALWSGLGYYRRARHMHAAARVIAFERRGKFPASAAELRLLPGIGRYTAAAIASISYGEPVAVVDGNVQRVLHRLYGEAPADPWQAASELLDARAPGDFNQAMMELGALVCVPQEPYCLVCPVRRHCHTQGLTPATRKRTRPRRESVWYCLCMEEDRILLQQRALNASLMPGMWELPSYEKKFGSSAVLQLRHSITDTCYEVNIAIGSAPRLLRSHAWVAADRVSALPLTGLARKVLSRLEILQSEESPWRY